MLYIVWYNHGISKKAAEISVWVSRQDKLLNWKTDSVAYLNDDQGVLEGSSGSHEDSHRKNGADFFLIINIQLLKKLQL